MNVKEIFEKGYYTIPNPEYNPKAKRNKQPPFINTLNERDSDPASDIFFKAGDDAFTIHGTQKYNDYNIFVKPGLNPQKELANAQSDWSKIGNALAQTVVSEIGLGTFRGISDMADFVLGNAFNQDNDYTNPVSQYIQSLQDDFNNNVAPIYADPDLDISNGGLLDAGWWAKNIPSVASSLTLLIPSTGFVKGLSWLGKATKVTSSTRKAVQGITNALKNRRVISEATDVMLNKPGTVTAVNRFIETGLTAATSRVMENYQESSQVWKDQYNDNTDAISKMSDKEYQYLVTKNKDILEGVNVEDKDAVAKALAKEAADRTFAIDMCNIGFDIVELYGLRNTFGKGMLGRNSSYSVRKAARQRARYADQLKGLDQKTIREEVKQLEKARSFGQKAKDFASDFIPGEGFVIASQLSEGAEEAVNYIAQEEGMHLGQSLLGNNDYSAFNGRLESYVNSPQLWESAFWGTLGGVVFQKVGSGFKRVQLTVEDRLAEKKNKNKDNETTGEQKAETSWKGLTQLPEVKRKVASIWDAQIKMNMAQDKIEQITNDEKLSEYEKDIAINDVQAKLKADIVLRSINDGTVGLLNSFVDSDNVKKAMIDKGIINEKDATSWQSQMKSDIKTIKDKYDTHIVNLDRQAAQLENDKKSGYIAIEAIQMAATDNVYRELQIEQNNKQAKRYLDEYDKYLANNKDAENEFTPQYQSALQLTTYTYILKDLYAARAEIKESIKNGDTLSKRLALQNVETQIKSVQNQLANSEQDFHLSKMLYAMSNVRDNLKLIGTESALTDFEKMDKAITSASEKGDFSALSEFFEIPEGKTYIKDEVDLKAFNQEYDKTLAETREAINGKKGINNVAPLSADNYRAYIQLQYQNSLLDSKIVRTKDQLQNYLTQVNNTLNEARVDALKRASENIENLFDKYGRDVVEGGIAALYNGNEDDYNIATTDMTDEDRTSFKNSVEVFNFANKANTPLYQSLQLMFDAREKANERQTKANEETNIPTSDEDNEVLNSDVPKSPTDSDNSETDNSSSEVSQSDTEQENGQQGNLSDKQQAKSKDKKMSLKLEDGTTVQLKGRFKRVTTDDSNNSFDYTATPDEYKYSELFDLDENVNLLDDKTPVKVVRRPTLVDGVWRKGKIVNVNNTTPVEESVSETEDQSQPNPLTELSNQLGNRSRRKVNPAQTPTTETNNPADDIEHKSDDSSTGGEQEEDPFNFELTDKIAEIVQSFNNVGKYEDVVAAIREQLKDYPDQEAVETEIKDIDDLLRSNFIVGDVIRASNKLEHSTNDKEIKEALEDINNASKALLQKYINSVDSYMFTNAQGVTKKIISLENLLRWSNEISFNNTAADAIYSTIKSYIDENSTKDDFEYIVVDKFEPQDQILSRAKKDINKANTDALGFQQEHRIGVNALIESFQHSGNEKQLKKLYATLENLKVDDKLSARKIGNQIALEVNGQVIAYMGVPKVIGPDTYRVVNEGWVYEINCNNGESPLKARFNRWLNGETKKDKDINALIFELCNKPSISAKDAERFMNSEAIREAIKDGLIEETADKQSLATGVVKLWRYIGSAINSGKTDRINLAISNSLDDWFEKLKNSYNTMYEVGHNVNNFEFTISRINSPKIREIISYDKTNINSVRDAAQPISEALTADNQATFEIAYKDLTVDENGNVDRYSIKLTDGTRFYPSQTSQIKPGTTMIALRNKNGDIRLTGAFPVSTKDAKLGRQAKDISIAIFNTLNTLIDDYFNKVDGSGERLLNFIDKIWKNPKLRNEGRYLFGGPIVTHMGKNKYTGLVLSMPNQPGIKIFKNNEWGQTSHAVAIPDKNTKPNEPIKLIDFRRNNNKDEINEIKKRFKDFIKTMFAQSTFELNYSALNYESNKNTPQSSFFEIDKNGSLNLRVSTGKNGDAGTVFNIGSYKNFILDNNLIRVNVAKGKNYAGEDTNFYSFDNPDQISNQTFYVNIKSKYADALEESKENENNNTESITRESDQIKKDVKDIINGKSKTKGIAIAKKLLNKEELKKVKNLITPIQGFGLLPKDIIFVDNIGSISDKLKDAYGAYDEKTGNIYVSQQWLDLLKTQRGRSEAVRKLIHEQIHKILHDSGKKQDILDKVNEVFEEYKDEVNNGTLKGNKIAEAFTKDGIEEFFVESLTNSDLIQILNDTKSKINNEKTSKSLFQKILELISDVFGWNVNKGSLREKEFIALGDIFKSNDLFSQQENIEEENKDNSQNKSKEENIDKSTPPSSEDNDYMSDMFNTDDVDTENNVYGSKIGEHPSIGSYVESLPPRSRETMINLIENGTIKTKCR